MDKNKGQAISMIKLDSIYYIAYNICCNQTSPLLRDFKITR